MPLIHRDSFFGAFDYGWSSGRQESARIVSTGQASRARFPGVFCHQPVWVRKKILFLVFQSLAIMEDSNKPPFNPALEELSRYLRDFSSNAEIILWNRLKDSQLGCEFTWQHPIGDYVVAFFCEEKKLAIDVESEAHTHPDAYFAAVKKQEDLKELGIRVLRLREEDVLADTDAAIDAVKKEMEAF